MAHYDPVIDQIITGGGNQDRDNLMRVVTDQAVPLEPPTEENPNPPESELSMHAFGQYPLWSRKTQNQRVNDIVDGADEKGALILVHVSSRDYLRFWRSVSMQRIGGEEVMQESWPDIEPDDADVADYRQWLLRGEDDSAPIKTPVLQISSLGDLVTDPDGLARARAVAQIAVSNNQPNPSHFRGDLMPLYVVARRPSGPQFDDPRSL